MIQKSVATFIVFFVIAFFIGGWGDIILNSFKAECPILFRLSFGSCLFMLLGMTVCFAGALFGATAMMCIYIIAILVLIVGITGAAFRKRMKIHNVYKPDTSIRMVDIIGLCVIFVIIVYQICAVMSYQSDNAQVLRGLSAATKVFETKKLFVSEPFSLFIGAVSAAMQLHPLLLVYAVIPAPLILMYYMCYFEVIRTVCETWHKTVIAFATVTLLNIWGYQSERLIPVTLLLSWFGFWVFLVHGVLNVSAILLIRYMQTVNWDEAIKENDSEDYSEEWDMKKHRIINARNLAICLGVLALVLAAAVFVLNNKINRLYAATVNLQEDMNSRCSIYEFKPDGEMTEGYLIKGSDGELSFIGGGDSDNAELLEEFLAGHGGTIGTWYIYGDDEENSGAVKHLISEGIVLPQKIYIIDRKEIKDIK